jgi:signal transduction histidine kinase/ligand-binding sensor domain-containing protein
VLVFPAANHLTRLLVFAGLVWFLAGSAAPASTNSTWFTRFWETDDGLINNNILATFQGQDNYLWVVPSVGLMRFDGVKFSRFPIEDITGPIDNHIRTALCGRTGVLWMVTTGGRVIGLRPDFSVVKVPATSLPGSLPASLAEDEEGALWVGYNNVIIRVKAGQVSQFATGEGVPKGIFHSLTGDGAGNIWLAKGNEIRLFRNGRFQPVARMAEVQSLAATHANGVWFVANTHLYACNTNGTLQDCGASPDFTHTTRRALLEDHTGAVWIGTDRNGLFRRDKSGFEQIVTSSLSIVALAEDREGNIWVSFEGGGLARVSLNGVQQEVSNSLDLEEIRSVCQDADGRLWGATQTGGLISKINGEWEPILTNAPFNGAVRCVAADAGGGIWIGTQDKKLLHLVDTNCTTWGNLAHGPINSLLPASNGDLWILAGDTLERLHDGQLKEMPLPYKIDGFISAIAEDAKGNIWVGAMGMVLRFTGNEFVDETPRLPISGHHICCLCGTPDGSMWISCGGLGLLRFKDGSIGQVGMEQGLFNDFISQIVADHHGRLWFGSDHGIFNVQQRELEQAMEDHTVRLRPIVYGRNEGLFSLEALFSTTAPFVLPRAFCTRDGRLWLFTHTAIVTADPKVVPKNDSPPPVLLTGVAMDGQTIANYGGVAPAQMVANLKTLQAPLRLPPGYRHLELDFTAFHFAAPENLHFRYQLAGFDNDWIDAGSDRHADYSRLTYGNYEFRIAACVGDGPWSESPGILAFTVLPFFWQTWWFRLGTVLLFTTSVVVIVRYISFRQQQAKMHLLEQRAALDRERTRIARDLHDDMGCTLNMVALTLDMTQREAGVGEALNGKIEHCSTIVRQVGRSVDQIVWAINPRNDTLRYMVDYISQFAVEFLNAADIPCRMDLPESFPDQMISPEARHNLLLVVKEALNNVLRHAHASEVRVRLTVSENQVTIVIEDNGRGFEHPPDNTSCDGLRNMRQRMEEIGGQFQLASRPGAGTRVAFLYSWPLHNGR